MSGKNSERDDALLLRMMYDNLIDISNEIHKDPDNPKLIEAYDSLLNTYFSVQEDGF